ncbi:hypothetical protein [Pseudarthrobacter sp. AB1]|uniref:hypothetical protein n=1 Tax=Pseudarthrobacter sp. AB1 TaxID=2138309 RepID=UPI00186B7F44|nr:hypothetical protein [Pseudarthrobacter sp. AB1]MBE4720498.1 hypothetical protein [Pseudarthrobacter sp. AB1]
MRPSTLHRFHHVTAGVRLELTWDRTPAKGLRSVLRRLAFGGPDPSSPQVAVRQVSFDRAMELLNASPEHLDAAEAAFRQLGYSVQRLEATGHVPA